MKKGFDLSEKRFEIWNKVNGSDLKYGILEKDIKEFIRLLNEEGITEYREYEYQDGNHTHTDDVEVLVVEKWKLKKLAGEKLSK